MRGLYIATIIFLFVGTNSAGPIAYVHPRSGPARSYNESPWNPMHSSSVVPATSHLAHLKAITVDPVAAATPAALETPSTTSAKKSGAVGEGAGIHALYPRGAPARAPFANYSSTPDGGSIPANPIVGRPGSALLGPTGGATPPNKEDVESDLLPLLGLPPVLLPPPPSRRPPTPGLRSSPWWPMYCNTTSTTTTSRPLATGLDPTIVIVTVGPSPPDPASASPDIEAVTNVFTETETVRVTVYESPTAPPPTPTPASPTTNAGELPTPARTSKPSVAASPTGLTVIAVEPAPTTLAVIPVTGILEGIL